MIQCQWCELPDTFKHEDATECRKRLQALVSEMQMRIDGVRAFAAGLGAFASSEQVKIAAEILRLTAEPSPSVPVAESCPHKKHPEWCYDCTQHRAETAPNEVWAVFLENNRTDELYGIFSTEAKARAYITQFMTKDAIDAQDLVVRLWVVDGVAVPTGGEAAPDIDEVLEYEICPACGVQWTTNLHKAFCMGPSPKRSTAK